MNIQQRFEAFHAANPNIYAKLVEFSRQVKASGFRHYSVNSLFERLRWHYQFDVQTAEPFKLNNTYRSRYARLVMQQEADLRDFFETRTLKAAA